MNNTERLNALWRSALDLYGSLPKSNEEERQIRRNIENALWSIEAAIRRQWNIDYGPLERPHVAARPWRTSERPAPTRRTEDEENKG